MRSDGSYAGQRYKRKNKNSTHDNLADNLIIYQKFITDKNEIVGSCAVHTSSSP